MLDYFLYLLYTLIMKSSCDKICQLANSLELNRSKFDNGSKVSATRLRQDLLAIKKLCDEVRSEVLTRKKSMPVKKREVKPKPVKPAAH